LGRSPAGGTCVGLSEVTGAGGRRPNSSAEAGRGGCTFGWGGGGGGGSGLGCSKVTSIGSSAGGWRGLSAIHQSASATRACSSTANASAEGDMWSERKEEVLMAWATTSFL
jgi:hypothetical protein